VGIGVAEGLALGSGLGVGAALTWAIGLRVGEPPSVLAAMMTTSTDAAMMPAIPIAGFLFTMAPLGTAWTAAIPRLG
jgi:hypothetical protein